MTRERARVDLPSVVDLAARGFIGVDDDVRQVYSLEDVNEGYKRLREGTMAGRGIVDMSP